MFVPFMSLTAGHQSTPFWCFAVPESSSHPPAHNPLCTHHTVRASAGRREGETKKVICYQSEYGSAIFAPTSNHVELNVF